MKRKTLDKIMYPDHDWMDGSIDEPEEEPKDDYEEPLPMEDANGQTNDNF